MIFPTQRLVALSFMLFASLACFAEGLGDSSVAPSVSSSASSSPACAMAGRINDTFNVGQVYVGGHIGMAVPLGIGAKDPEIAFNEVAKTGFALFADGMRQMNQRIGLGAELGVRTYPYNDKKKWNNLTRYGTFEAKYTAFDVNLTGRLFITDNSLRPFFGILVGGEIIHNTVDFTPTREYSGVMESSSYSASGFSPAFGGMAGVYFKAGKRTLISIQARISVVPSVPDGEIEVTNTYGDIQHMKQNQHGNQTNLGISVGLHVGTNKNNKH